MKQRTCCTGLTEIKLDSAFQFLSEEVVYLLQVFHIAKGVIRAFYNDKLGIDPALPQGFIELLALRDRDDIVPVSMLDQEWRVAGTHI